ncbi:MAG: tetratricopeptide repeat protein [Bacteroidales bacterium]|nr:tetratricopeptide repeat protein [Bacteroidales bacterium]
MRKKVLISKILTTIVLGVFLSIYSFSMEAVQPDKQKHHKDPGQPVVAIPGNTGMLIDAKKEAIVGNTKGALEMFSRYIDRFPQDPVGYFEAGKLEAQQKNFQEAIGFTKQACTLDPENIWYSLFLAEIYQIIGNIPDAISIYETIVNKNPTNLDYFYQLAALYLQVEKFTDAVRIYDQIQQKVGISEDISLQKEKIYLHQNNLNNAENELQQLILAFPGEPRYLSILAEFYMANNMSEKALEIYKQVAVLDPENAYIHMSLADYYRKTGNKEKAYEELKLGFANPNLDVDTKVNILLSFYTVNQIFNDLKEQAFTLSKILIDTHPNDPKVYSIYGDLLTQDKKYSEARDAFLKTAALDSSKYAIFEQILRLDLQLGLYNELLSHSQRTTELFPDQPLPFMFSGIAALQLKQYTSALKSLHSGEQLVVSNDELLSQFYMYDGDVCHALKDELKAFEAYEKSLQLKYDNAYVLNNYAYYLSLQGKNLDKAEKMSKKAVDLDPENTSFQDTYGWVLFKQGKYNEAREWILKALQKKEEVSAEVLEHYGDVLYKLGDTEQAVEYWKEAKKKDPDTEGLDKKIATKKIEP